MPASLDGTEVPDGLQVDAQGRLIATMQLRDIFDYFLSSLGEEDLDTLVARIRAYLSNNLPEAAAFEANRILDGYLAWRDNLASIQEAGGVSASELDLQAVRAQQDAVRASCQRFLDAQVCAVFFAEQQLRDDYDIARIAILQDDSLSANEKAARVASLTAALPAPMQQQIDAVTRYQTLQAITTSLQQEGGDAAALRTVREQVVGVEAADRLEQLDQQRAQFNARIDQWLMERGALLANTGLSATDRDAQISRLRAQRFSAEELTRVQALERIHDTGQ